MSFKGGGKQILLLLDWLRLPVSPLCLCAKISSLVACCRFKSTKQTYNSGQERCQSICLRKAAQSHWLIFAFAVQPAVGVVKHRKQFQHVQCTTNRGKCTDMPNVSWVCFSLLKTRNVPSKSPLSRVLQVRDLPCSSMHPHYYNLIHGLFLTVNGNTSANRCKCIQIGADNCLRRTTDMREKHSGGC